MDRYPPIAEHGLIGDLQTAALVSTDGTVDWFCCPRFDAPSVFASLLDRDRGGRFRIAAESDSCVVKQLYFPDTAILITRFMSPEGVGEVIDFMPVDEPDRATDRHRLVRAMRCVRGQMRFVVDCAPRFDYGRQTHELELTKQGAVFRTPELTLTLHGPAGLERHGDDVHGTVTLQAGQIDGVVLESAADAGPRHPSPEDLMAMFTETAHFWRGWLARSTYRGRWREMVHRAAMTLKLMTYAPTGALVAAPTAGLPEQVGGERNWDYRYTWIRDASFSVHALLGLGFTDEAEAFMRWLADRIDDQAGNGSGPLKIMYRIDGSSDLDEETLDHFEGYQESAPVRIGNGATDQLQLDIYGEMLDSIWLADQHGLRLGHSGWVKLCQIAEWLCEHWDQPDEGVWETHGGRQRFTYGRLMVWVALDRMIRLAQGFGRPADLARWTTERDRVYQQIIDIGWNPERGAFTQHDKTTVLDASLLMLPLTGFVVPTDSMWLSTLKEMEGELVSDSLVYRYDPGASPDGLLGDEGTFSICTFWYVDALARSGRLEQARLTFEKMFTYANHLGLYAEEIGLTGEQLGNFPQAFTHLSLINAAINLDYRLDHGAEDDPVRPRLRTRGLLASGQRRFSDKNGVDWPGYLQRFHEQRPGITEDVLAHAVDKGTSPYTWAVEAVQAGPVLDLACGSGPLVPALAAMGWVGLDRSQAELSVARRHGGDGRVAQADAASLPVADGAAGSVVCSMALMLVEPLDKVLAEVARVLSPGGAFVALVPSRSPLRPLDVARYARLLAALRTRRLDYPNDRPLDDVDGLLRRHGLRVVEDQRRRFCCPITSPSVGVMCVRSLYLPDIEPQRLAAGEAVARRWVGTEIGLPLRRLVAVRDTSPLREDGGGRAGRRRRLWKHR